MRQSANYLGNAPDSSTTRRKIEKAPEAAPRTDKLLNRVIINDEFVAGSIGHRCVDMALSLFRQGGKKIAAKQVSELPFPFQRPDQFERSIRLPVGMSLRCILHGRAVQFCAF